LGCKKERGEQESIAACQEKRRTHARWAKKAVGANESSLGSQKESCVEVTSLPSWHQDLCLASG
jgi:hypothetical protein